jgi:hypothetical protein
MFNQNHELFVLLTQSRSQRIINPTKLVFYVCWSVLVFTFIFVLVVHSQETKCLWWTTSEEVNQGLYEYGVELNDTSQYFIGVK